MRDLQPYIDQWDCQLPEPFRGTSANAGIVFRGLNPSYGGPKWVPPLGTKLEESDTFYRHRYDGDASKWGCSIDATNNSAN
jgi:hypothetical protein